jgi:hypothetical protein
MMIAQHGRIWLTALVLASLGMATAQAQINPFRSSKQGAGLTNADVGMLEAAVEQLNSTNPLHVGDSQDWSNSDTGNSGKVTVTRLFQSGGMACHGMRYDLSYKDKRPPAQLMLNWCKTAAGEWKIKS